MDRTKQPSGVANDGSHKAIKHDGDPFEKSSTATGHKTDDAFVNEYAEASQARETGRSPQPIERPQSSRPNARSAPVHRKDPSAMENLATGSQEQHPDLGADSVGCASSKTDCHAQPTAPAVIPRLMTDQGVATYLGCSVRTVWRLLEKDPDFPQPIKIGGSTRWDPVEIDCYVDVCKARRPNGR